MAAPSPPRPAPSAAGRPGRPPSRRWWLRSALALACRPGLWPIAIAQAARLAGPGWWRRRPYLPVPDPEYVRFRLETAYGPGGEPDPSDLVDYLRWCRHFPRR